MFNSRWVSAFILFLACLAAYFNSFTNNFLFDDNSILFGPSGMLNRSFYGIFTATQGDFYRPVGHIPLWIASRFLGDHYAGYHVLNFLLFFLIVFSFYLIVEKLTSNSLLAFFSALFYGIHPINGFIVNYVTASVIAVFVLLMQLSFLCFIRFFETETGKRNDYVLGFILFVYACFSHEMAFMLPAYLVTYLFLVKGYSWSRVSKLMSPFIFFFGAWFVFRSQEFIFHRNLVNFLSLSRINIQKYFSTWMDLINWYVSKLFLPHNILYMFNGSYQAEHLLCNVICFIVVLALSLYAIYRWKRNWKSFLLAVFIFGFLPTIFSCFVYFPSMILIEPHWFYFSEISFFVLLGCVVQKVINRNKSLGILFAVSIALALMVSSWVYNSKWKTQGAYSRYWLSLNTKSLIPYTGLGRSLMDRGDYVAAIKVYEDAVKQADQMTASMAADMGHCWDMLGEDQKSLSFLITAMQMNRGYALTYQYLGIYYAKRHDPVLAQKAFGLAVGLDPHIASTYLRKLY